MSANLCIAALGSETDGSIMSPSSNNGIVGIKPTVGLTSGKGVIPISHTQDVVGPHARTVADAAAVLSAIAESGMDYRAVLNRDALQGARIGVARKFHTGYSEHTDRVFDSALDVLERLRRRADRRRRDPWPRGAARQFRGHRTDAPSELSWSTSSKPTWPRTWPLDRMRSVKSLADLIRFNEEHAAEEMPYFRQELFEARPRAGPLTDPLYQRALEHDLQLCARVRGNVRRTSLRCAGRADECARLGHRPARRRPLPGQQLASRGGRRLSAGDRARPASPWTCCRSA